MVTLIEFRSSKAGRNKVRSLRRFTMSRGRAIASRIRKPARCRQSADTVDIKDASYKNTIGATELKKGWTDPEFDPSQHAFYYARVIQIPTPRWTTYDAKKLGVPPLSSVPASVQERAWTSPIWFSQQRMPLKKRLLG